MCSATRVRALVLAALLAGCEDHGETGPDDPVRPAECLIGDPDAAPELELVYRTVDGTLASLERGGRVPLILPPQGGKVLLVGIRARNVDGCGLRITAALRDPCTGRVLGLDRRPVFLVDDGSGWAVPRQVAQLSDYANIPACPNFATERDVDEQELVLEVEIEDIAGRTARAETRLTPYCGEAQHLAQCACECDADYVLGRACEPDGDGGGGASFCGAGEELNE